MAADNINIADFSIAAWIPAAQRLQLAVANYKEIEHWFYQLASLPAWRASMVPDKAQ
jgi:hypothetical protein